MKDGTKLFCHIIVYKPSKSLSITSTQLNNLKIVLPPLVDFENLNMFLKLTMKIISFQPFSKGTNAIERDKWKCAHIHVVTLQCG